MQDQEHWGVSRPGDLCRCQPPRPLQHSVTQGGFIRCGLKLEGWGWFCLSWFHVKLSDAAKKKKFPQKIDLKFYSFTRNPSALYESNSSFDVTENPSFNIFFCEAKIDCFDVPHSRRRYKNHEERRQGEIQEDQNWRTHELHGLHGESATLYFESRVLRVSGSHSFWRQYDRTTDLVRVHWVVLIAVFFPA